MSLRLALTPVVRPPGTKGFVLLARRSCGRAHLRLVKLVAALEARLRTVSRDQRNLGLHFPDPLDAAALSQGLTSQIASYKFGAYIERNHASEGPRSNFGGNFSFGRDVNNPGDTNYAYSNALLGNFQTYTEATTRTTGRGKNYLLEWFAQDTWKVTKKLTVDYGRRFSYFSPWRLRKKEGAAFDLKRYNPAKAQ